MTIPWHEQHWRRALVYGLGISGRAAAAVLRHRGIEVVALDERAMVGTELGPLAGDPGVELMLGPPPESLPSGLDAVVVSPGVPLNRPLLQAARDAGLPVLAEVELAFPLLDGPVIGITGSNGKSTTTALAGAMLRAGGHRVEVCGNIGEALTARLSEMVGEVPGRIFVVELSSFQLETIDRFHPQAAALLNLTPDHLDRHADFAAYRDAKVALFRSQVGDDLAVLNAGDPEVADLPLTARCRYFASRGTVRDGCHLQGDTVVEVVPGGEASVLFERQDMPLPGLHNLENAMAAALLARSFGVAAKTIRRAVQGFCGLPHRLEWVGQRHGVDWYDDSKGTNLAATVRSLEGFADNSVHIILGGIYKGGDLTELCEAVERKACRAYLIGQAAPTFGEALAARQVAHEHCGELASAVGRASETASVGQCVLLSPACSSFDQFPNFAERGRVFKRLVRALDGLQEERHPQTSQRAPGRRAMAGAAPKGDRHGA